MMGTWKPEGQSGARGNFSACANPTVRSANFCKFLGMAFGLPLRSFCVILFKIGWTISPMAYLWQMENNGLNMEDGYEVFVGGALLQ